MLVRETSRGDFRIPSRCMLGRSALADIRLVSRRSSSEHALIAWQSGRWTIRDLGSSNGTSVDGTSLAARERVTLREGSHLRFGDDDEVWEVLDLRAPNPAAMSLGPQRLHWGDPGLLVLPSIQAPEASIYYQDHRWHLDDGTRVLSPDSGDIVPLASGYYRLFLPEGAEAGDLLTQAQDFDIRHVTLAFELSSERLLLGLEQGSMRAQLPSRACLHSLLTLARLRLRHADAGWIACAELAQARGCTQEKVNVDVHRLRKLFQEAGVRGASQIIERDDSKRLRIGVARITGLDV